MKKHSATLADWRPTRTQIQSVNKVLQSGRLTYGPYTRELEAKFAAKHNFKYCIFMNSGTSALEIAWRYLKDQNGWEDGDEVIVPAVTFVATVNTILHNRLKPVLVDVNPDNFNIDVNLIETAITKKTRAICPVDLLGRPCDIQIIRKIAEKYKLKIVEDSCETMFVFHPSGKEDVPVGSKADIACYSSYLAHIISTGVGGFLCTNSKSAERYMRSMIWHGRDDSYLHIDANNEIPLEKLIHARFRFDKIGYSYRLTELEAALGIDEVERADYIIFQREMNALTLQDLLRKYDTYIKLPEFGYSNAWMFFPIVCRNGVNRDDLALFLEKKGVQTRWIMPLTNQPVYKGLWNPKDYPVADFVNKNGFLIGVHHFMTSKDLQYITRCFKEYFK